MNYYLCCCKYIEQIQNSSGMSLGDWVAAGISIVTLLLNILFYIIIAPKISFRFQKKEDFLKCSSEFISYLSEVNSFTCFDGVPTKVKSYCVSIKLLFKSGEAPEPLKTQMEKVFQLVKRRKELSVTDDIKNWEEEFKNETHLLRQYLAKYTGIF